MRKILFLILCISYMGISASGKELSFDHIDLSNGLSQTSVMVVEIDSLGRIWMGTRNGVNVFDGENIRVFKPTGDKTSSLIGRHVNDLLVHNSEAYVVVNEGLSIIDLRTEEIRNLPFKRTYSVGVGKDHIILGTQNGISVINRYDFSDVVLEIDTLNTVEKIIPDGNEGFWICSAKGLFKIDNTFQKIEHILSGSVYNLKVDSRKNIWVCTVEEGLILLDRKYNILRQYKHQETDDTSIANDFIRCIEEDFYGNMWIGTLNGLSILDVKTSEIQNYYHQKEDVSSLSHNSIYEIQRDENGVMWIGTFYGGLNYYNEAANVYKFYSKGEEGNGLSYQVIGGLLEDEKKNIWVCTQGGGLNYLDRINGNITHFKHDEYKNSISHNNLYEIQYVNKNNLVIATHLGGLDIYNLEEKKFYQYTDKELIPYGIVRCILPRQEEVLIGSHIGLSVFNINTKQIKPFLSNHDNLLKGVPVRSLYEDSKDVIWIGTESEGIYTYDTNSKVLSRFLPSNVDSVAFAKCYMAYLYEDTDFRVWIGTVGDGLYLYNRENNTVQNFTSEKDHIAGDIINGIVESRYGWIWVSTSNGLTRIDADNMRFYNYTAHEGFPLRELNYRSMLLTSDGELFVGGIDGMVSFREEDLLKQENNYQIIFSDLFVNNKPIKPGDDTKILSNTLHFSDSIILNADANVFRLHYSACNYNKILKSRFEYKLEGFDNDWIDNGQRDYISYTNLDPQTYKLKVRVFNASNENIVDEKQLTIIVKPPFYATWYAYLVYLLVFVGLLWLFISMYVFRIRLNEKLGYEIKDKENIRELNKAKLSFFTNISHEFRTPLTLISGTLENILIDSKVPASVSQKLGQVKNNADRLKRLVTELLDFRKIEQQGITVKVSENEINTFVQAIVDNFQSYSLAKGIDLSFHKEDKICGIWFDPYQMEKVFFNLISNALKFIEAGSGKIIISVKEHHLYWDIIVTDNGRGMDKDEIGKVFERFYHLDKIGDRTSNTGTGIGLALCKGIVDAHQGEILVNSIKGEGTSFTVRLKKGKEHYSQNQLEQESTWKAQEIPVEVNQYLPESSEIESDRSVKLLIVEDNEEVRGLLKMIFSEYYQVIEAVDGKEGIEMAVNENPDLIISDVMMPNVDGIQLCTTLKRNEETCHIPIILLTAKTSEESKMKGFETGADAYIEKPFNTQILKLRVKNILNNKWNLQKKFQQNPDVIEIKEIGLNKLDQQLLEKAIAIVEENLENVKFGVEEFAKEMGLGRTRLFSKIKGVTGQTPNDFILSIRMKKAQGFLANNPEMNVSDIAYATGFTTPGYFSKCFRNYYSMSPLQYRSAKNE